MGFLIKSVKSLFWDTHREKLPDSHTCAPFFAAPSKAKAEEEKDIVLHKSQINENVLQVLSGKALIDMRTKGNIPAVFISFCPVFSRIAKFSFIVIVTVMIIRHPSRKSIIEVEDKFRTKSRVGKFP